MEGTPRKARTYYRCAVRTMVPGSPDLNGHPTNVYLPEESATKALNMWLVDLFARENVDRTVSALVASQEGVNKGTPDAHEAAKKRLQSAEGKLRRFQDAVAAGVDPAAMVEAINEAQAQRAAAQAELENAATSKTTDRIAAEVYAIIDSLGDIQKVTKLGDPAKLQELYQALDVQMLYKAEGRTVDVTIRPKGRDKAGVRGGT